MIFSLGSYKLVGDVRHSEISIFLITIFFSIHVALVGLSSWSTLPYLLFLCSQSISWSYLILSNGNEVWLR